jgi:1-acyl-sn-glycerol-3-phosphate acyltransferase
MFKNVFGRFWAFWGLLSFMVTFIIIFLPSMASHLFRDEKKGQAYFIKVSKSWMQVWLLLIGCPLKIRGKEHFKSGSNYIVVFNHNALLDVPLSAPFVPGANKTIAKSSFAKFPLFGLFYKRGAVLVNRKDEKSRVKSFEEMKEVLRLGLHMCIYPEGTRNRSKEPLKPFYDGAFKLAVESGKEIIPCIITGTRKAMPIHKPFYLWPTRLGMDFLEPVSPNGKTSKQINQEVFELMLNGYRLRINEV